LPSAQGPKVNAFYHSKVWAKCRDSVVRMRHGICELCGKAGKEVHHKVPLTESNVSDPNVSINPDNLMVLCKSCHDSIRANENGNIKRCLFASDGSIMGVKDTPPGVGRK
jgi:Predicted restriction endonuclease